MNEEPKQYILAYTAMQKESSLEKTIIMMYGKDNKSVQLYKLCTTFILRGMMWLISSEYV